MKTLTLLLFITLQLLGGTPDINEHKTDLYFANGINTAYSDAQINILTQDNQEIFEKVQGYYYRNNPKTESKT